MNDEPTIHHNDIDKESPAVSEINFSLVEAGKKALISESDALRDTAHRLGLSFAQASQAIFARKGKVVVTGMGKSGHVGRKIASTLSSTGTSATFLHPSEALHGDFGMLQHTDVLLAIAYGGETHEVVEAAKFARRMPIPVIAMTGDLKSSLSQLSHFVLDCSVESEADPLNLAPTNSSTVTMALGDALAISLMVARGFSQVEFASLHPGGSLGRRLSLVKDHMHPADKLPKVGPESTFDEILRGVTVDNFGIVAVIDPKHNRQLIGAISDGDLRRSLLNQGPLAMTQKAKDIMSTNPKIVEEDSLAIDAATLMTNMAISRLFVVSSANDGMVVGLIRLQDLLTAKII